MSVEESLVMYIGTYVTDRDNVTLEQRRGIGTIDLNSNLILVRSSIENVVEIFEQVIQTLQLERNVCGRQIEIRSSSLVILQFQGHCWTTILSPFFKPLSSVFTLNAEAARSFSHVLNTKTIYYQVSDTGSYIGYELFDYGNSLEKLYFSNSACEFQSTLRQLEKDYVTLNAYHVVFKFIEEQDAYVPAFIWNDSCRDGQTVTFQIKGLRCADCSRVDYAVAAHSSRLPGM